MLTQVFALVLYSSAGAMPLATFPDQSSCVVNGIMQMKAAHKVGFPKAKYTCIESVVVTAESTGYPGPAGAPGAQGPAGSAGARGPAGEGCAEHCKKAKPGKRCDD